MAVIYYKCVACMFAITCFRSSLSMCLFSVATSTENILTKSKVILAGQVKDAYRRFWRHRPRARGSVRKAENKKKITRSPCARQLQSAISSKFSNHIIKRVLIWIQTAATFTQLPLLAPTQRAKCKTLQQAFPKIELQDRYSSAPKCEPILSQNRPSPKNPIELKQIPPQVAVPKHRITPTKHRSRDDWPASSGGTRGSCAGPSSCQWIPTSNRRHSSPPRWWGPAGCR